MGYNEIMAIPSDKINQISKMLIMHNIKLAYLFGSQSTGKTKPNSDIDIAVFFNSSVNQAEADTLRLDIMQKITNITNNDAVDVVPLSKAPILLKFKILKDRKILVDQKPAERVMFEHKVMSSYFDRKYYIDRHSKSALNRFANKGIS